MLQYVSAFTPRRREIAGMLTVTHAAVAADVDYLVGRLGDGRRAEAAAGAADRARKAATAAPQFWIVRPESRTP